MENYDTDFCRFKGTVAKIQENFSLQEVITRAKERMAYESKNIQEQIENMVALYNIGDRKAFYFLTSAEARLAIEHINELRSDYKKDIQKKQEMDLEINNFIIESDWGNMEDWKIQDINGTEVPYMINRLMTDGLKHRGIFGNYEIEEDKDTCCGFSLNILNKAFSIVEGHNLKVDAIILNSFMFTYIRSWGLNVYEPLTNREIERRKQSRVGAIAEIFGADIYRFNFLPDYQFILYNSDANSYFIMGK